jgi:hypothetical protein
LEQVAQALLIQQQLLQPMVAIHLLVLLLPQLVEVRVVRLVLELTLAELVDPVVVVVVETAATAVLQLQVKELLAVLV